MIQKLIFLDIDGVLNRHVEWPNRFCGTEPECVAAFNRVIRETDADIIVSSA